MAAYPEPGERPELPTRARVRWYVLALLTGLVLYLCWRMLEPFATVLLWSASLAALFHPLRSRLVQRLGRPSLAALLTLLVAVVVVLVPVGVVSLLLWGELTDLVSNAPAHLERLLANPDSRLRLAEIREEIARFFPGVPPLDAARLKELAAPLGDAIFRQSLGLAGNLLQGALRFAFIVFTLFFFLRDAERVVATVARFLPLPERRARRLLRRMDEVLQAATYGVVVIALVQGLLGGAMFAVLGLPTPVLWGVVMALLAMIPMVGASVVWLPAAILLAIGGQHGKAIVLTLWGVLVVSTIDNLLRPLLVGQRARLHPLLVFFSVLGALRVFGVVGVLVGPVVVATALTLLDMFRPTEPDREVAFAEEHRADPGEAFSAQRPPDPRQSTRS